jgi:DnaK suppressor protein
MSPELSPTRLKAFKQALETRLERAYEEIRGKLLQSDDERYIELAGTVHDLEEASVADLLADINLAVIDLNIDEVREIEAALLRIGAGTYGVCDSCQGAIEPERLRAHPTALRCHRCQERHEQTHAGRAHPKL